MYCDIDSLSTYSLKSEKTTSMDFTCDLFLFWSLVGKPFRTPLLCFKIILQKRRHSVPSIQTFNTSFADTTFFKKKNSWTKLVKNLGDGQYSKDHTQLSHFCQLCLYRVIQFVHHFQTFISHF